MSSLIGSSRMVDNHTMRARTSAAVRRVASSQVTAGGAEGQLATAALLNPEFVVPAFLVRIAVNPAVVESACHDCGYSGVQDSDLLYVVTEAWSDVAAAEYPATDPA